MGAATCAAVLQPLPISHHFHGFTALLVLRFVVVKWRYIKYLALPFFPRSRFPLIQLGGLGSAVSSPAGLVHFGLKMLLLRAILSIYSQKFTTKFDRFIGKNA